MTNNKTIADVAIAANTSIATVSRVMSGSTYPVSQAKRKAVLDAAEKLHYEPNIIGRILKTKQNLTIGIIIPTFHNPYFTQLVQGIEQEANNHGYYTMTVSSQRDYELERKLITNFKNNNIKALLISSVDKDAISLKKYINSGGFVCLFESNIHELEGAINAQVDSFVAAQKATQYLIMNGHTRIAYLSTSLDTSSRFDRLSGIKLEMANQNLPFGDEDIFFVDQETDQIDGLFEFEVGKLLAKDFLNSQKRHTAIIAANDMIAIGIMKYLQDNKINIPNDISIISFDNIHYSECTNPPLTTMNLPSHLLGKHTCKAIIEALTKNEIQKDMILSVSASLVERNTVKKIL